MLRNIFFTEKPNIETERYLYRDCTTQAKDYLRHSIKEKIYIYRGLRHTKVFQALIVSWCVESEKINHF